MKLQAWEKENGKEKLVKEVNGKVWNGKRFYVESPKGAFVNLEKRTYHKDNYDKSGRKLGEWFTCSSAVRRWEQKYELKEEEK